jgi:hypothetical protein
MYLLLDYCVHVVYFTKLSKANMLVSRDQNAGQTREIIIYYYYLLQIFRMFHVLMNNPIMLECWSLLDAVYSCSVSDSAR